MSVEPTSEDLAAVSDLLERSTLQGIEHIGVIARRLKENRQRNESVEGADIDLHLSRRQYDGGFGILMSCRVMPYMSEFLVDVAAEYSVEGEAPDDRTLRAFANEVAALAIFPYVRETISSMTAKVIGQAVHLPIIQRRQVAFDLDSDE